MGGIIRKTYLIFPEQDQSHKTNLRMFKLDNKLFWEKNTGNGDHLGAWGDVIKSLAKRNALKKICTAKKLHAIVCHSFAS